ncbi:hypothetical protein HWV62_13673 [Athelia sp. TMB]|nr:hypothetical protein HWV62_13673 [Athelia sp. TMB]
MFTESREIPNLHIKRVSSPFTPAEILEYLAVVQFTPLPTLPPLDAPQNWPDFAPTLANLEALMRRHLLAFPYENTEAHYTPNHLFSYRPRDVFARLVRARRGLGSVCIGHNTLFKGILQGLGYLCYSTAAGVDLDWQTSRGPPKLGAMAHMINLVLPCDTPSPEYPEPVPHLVDVGYGGIGEHTMLLRPLPLIHGATVTSFCAPEEHRLMRGPRPANESALQGNAPVAQGWFLQARASPRAEWRTPHWFSTAEYTESDFEWISFCISMLLTDNVAGCIKLHELPSGEIARMFVGGSKAVRKVGKRLELLEQWKWEEERIEGFRRLIGLCLDEEEALRSVRGRGVALPIRHDAQGVPNASTEAQLTQKIHSRL